MPESISFGTWLRQKRRALDLTQKALANQIGCAEITIRRMDADAYMPSRELASVLLGKLGISERERPQWISFARGISNLPTQTISSPSCLISNNYSKKIRVYESIHLFDECEQLVHMEFSVMMENAPSVLSICD